MALDLGASTFSCSCYGCDLDLLHRRCQFLLALMSVTVDENLDNIFCPQTKFFGVTLCAKIAVVYLYSLNLLCCY